MALSISYAHCAACTCRAGAASGRPDCATLSAERSPVVAEVPRAQLAGFQTDKGGWPEPSPRTAALKVPLNLRIDRKLDTHLKQRAAAAQIPTSALVPRLRRQAMREPGAPVLTEERVEAITRRVLAETKAG